MPEVSVIIPNYNHAAYLRQRIESVLMQTFQDFEVVILDDCSTDNSKEIIESYRTHPKVRSIIFNQENSGSPFKQWKKGIELATGKYVWIAESDDWALPDFLSILITKIGTLDNVGICFCASNWIDDRGQTGPDLSLYSTSFYVRGKEEIRNKLVKYNTIQNASSALIRRTHAIKSIAKAVQFKSAGDWIFYISILMKSDLMFVELKLNNFRWYHDNTSNKAILDGTSITEGFKVLAKSPIYQLRFSKSEIHEIKYWWLSKLRHFNCRKFSRIRLLSYSYFILFLGRYHLHNGYSFIRSIIIEKQKTPLPQT